MKGVGGEFAFVHKDHCQHTRIALLQLSRYQRNIQRSRKMTTRDKWMQEGQKELQWLKTSNTNTLKMRVYGLTYMPSWIQHPSNGSGPLILSWCESTALELVYLAAGSLKGRRELFYVVYIQGEALCLVQGSCWGFYTLITRKHFCVLFSVFLLIHFISCCLLSYISNSCSHNISPTVWEDTVCRSQYILHYTPGRTICLLLLDIFTTDYLQQQRVWLLRADPLQWMSCK